jgi:hypothetical protein
MLYAFVRAPLMGTVGIAKGLLDPASTQTAGDAFNMLAPEALEI